MPNTVNTTTAGIVNETIPPSQTNGGNGTNLNVPTELTSNELLNRIGEMIDTRIQAIRNELNTPIQTIMPFMAPLQPTMVNQQSYPTFWYAPAIGGYQYGVRPPQTEPLPPRTENQSHNTERGEACVVRDNRVPTTYPNNVPLGRQPQGGPVEFNGQPMAPPPPPRFTPDMGTNQGGYHQQPAYAVGPTYHNTLPNLPCPTGYGTISTAGNTTTGTNGSDGGSRNPSGQPFANTLE